MAAVAGSVVVIVLAVVYVWNFGLIGGAIAWLATFGLFSGVGGYIMRKHYNPMAVYDAEQAVIRHQAHPSVSTPTTSPRQP